MLLFFVPSDEDEVSEDPRPVPRKSKKKYGKVIQHILIFYLDFTSWFMIHEDIEFYSCNRRWEICVCS